MRSGEILMLMTTNLNISNFGPGSENDLTILLIFHNALKA
jgi:hypothetical protein